MIRKLLIACAFALATGSMVCSGSDNAPTQAEKDLIELEKELLNTSDGTAAGKGAVCPEADVTVETSSAFKQAVDDLVPLENSEDIEAFHARLGALFAHQARGVVIRTLEEAQKRPFTDLSAKEAQKSKDWYRHPKAVLAISPEWVKYYAETVVPKVDAFLRPLATKVVEIDEEYKLCRNEKTGAVEVDWSSSVWRQYTSDLPRDCRYYYQLVPKQLEEYEPSYQGKVIHTRLIIYCLPSPYGLPDLSVHVDSLQIFWHVYDTQRKHIYSIDSHYSRRTDWGDYDRIPGLALNWMVGDNYLALPLLEDSEIYLGKDNTYGGSFVSLKNAETYFPELKQETRAQGGGEVIQVGAWDWLKALLSNPYSLILTILVVGSVPYMIVTLVLEYRKRYIAIPLPEDYDRAADSDATLRAEVQELIDMRNAMETVEQRDTTERLPIFSDRKEANTFTGLLQKAAALSDLTNAEKYELNRLGYLRNDLCRRNLNGSVKLLIVAVIYAVVVWWLFSFYALIALPIYYLLTLLCPTYILAREEPKLLRGIRNMLRGLAFVSSLFASSVASQRFVTVYTDGYGNYYTNSDEGSAHVAIALGILIMVLLFIPLLILIDGLCNFFRNYVLSK